MCPNRKPTSRPIERTTECRETSRLVAEPLSDSSFFFNCIALLSSLSILLCSSFTGNPVLFSSARIVVVVGSVAAAAVVVTGVVVGVSVVVVVVVVGTRVWFWMKYNGP